MELAILDVLGQQEGQTIEHLLSVAPLEGLFYYTAVLGDAKTGAFAAMAEQYFRRGFTDYKVKLSGEENRDREKLDIFRAWPAATPFRIRADANNLWETPDEAIDAIRRLDYSLFAIEEPLRDKRYVDLARIADALQCKVVLDESFLRVGQFSSLPDPPGRWLINIRVSKMGGILRSLDIVDGARSRGIGVIVGAQVGETSLLTRAGLTVARAAGDALVAQEGAFGTLLLEHDVSNPVLMFGAGGVLDASTYPSLKTPAFGLSYAATSHLIP
jgi:L-alanine-DL-glutamate epimerase-like enolase superfamily enzyme